jgi:heme-degrading monooxygenase HmoA
MIIVLFRSRLTDAAGADYSEMAAEMLERAKSYPGFIDFKSFKAEDGERLSVVRWENEETLRPWREDERHRVAQRAGREKWYEQYNIEVTQVIRSREFQRR